MASKPSERRQPATIRLPLWVLGLIGVLLLVLVVASAVWLFRTVRDMAAAASIEDPQFVAAADGPQAAAPGTEGAAGDAGEVPTEEPLAVLSPDEVQPWSGHERLNILLMGVDQRCDDSGPTHTDTIMIATIDPVGMSASLLSLPRDLWVEIPGFEVDRINQAYYFGQVYEYPGGGEALAMETVELLLGVPIDYYLTVNFQAFIEAVDQIGGVVIDVPEAIDDPDYPDNCYGYEPFEIQAGMQRLDGTAALKYARTRATLGGDVDRAARQQQVILAVREQVLRLNQLPQLILQAPQLWRTFNDNVKTNLVLEDIVQLALLLQEFPEDSINTVVLDYDYVFIETTPDGRQVLVPRRDAIRTLRNDVFAIPAVPTPVIENLDRMMQDEGARVAIHNGTSVFGLAGRTQEYLQDLGVNVTEIGNADSAAYGTSQIIDYGSHMNTVRFLQSEMGIPPLNATESQDEPDGEYDVLVIIGEDWAEILEPAPAEATPESG